MKKNPLVSIIIPMYNAEKFIAECLDSIVSQTYRDLEIIVVDDNSTDKSAEIVKAYNQKHKNIIYVKTKNGNAAKTRRDGVKKAKADLVSFVDADDVISNKYIEHLCKTLKKTNTSISACSSEVFSGAFKLRQEYNKLSPVHIINSDAHSFATHFHITDDNKLTLQTWHGKLFKKQLFDNIDYTVFTTNLWEDVFMMVQVLQKVNKISVINEVLYWHRELAESTSGRTIFTKVEYEGKQLNSVEFFKDVVMEYCRKMLPGPNVDAEIDKLSAAEFFMYARIVPNLMAAEQHFSAALADKDRQIAEILNSKRYKTGNLILSPAAKVKKVLKG